MKSKTISILLFFTILVSIIVTGQTIFKDLNSNHFQQTNIKLTKEIGAKKVNNEILKSNKLKQLGVKFALNTTKY